MNEPVIVPARMEQVDPAAIMLPVNMHFVSLSEKPEPDTETDVVTAPDGGFGMVIVMLWGLTVNEAVASHVSIPGDEPMKVSALIVYVPIETGTVKLPVKMPLAIVQVVGLGSGSPAKEQELSFRLNPTPYTLTDVPSGPDDGLRTSDGERTVNEAEE
jgi:hypothetical protein